MMALWAGGACPQTHLKTPASDSFFNKKTPGGLAEQSDPEVSRVQIRVAVADRTADL